MKKLIAALSLSLSLGANAATPFQQQQQAGQLKQTYQAISMQVKLTGCLNPGGGIMSPTEEHCKAVLRDMLNINAQITMNPDLDGVVKLGAPGTLLS